MVQIPERLGEQPDLTRHVWIFFHHYGRSLDEIARRLGISRRRAKRLRERAEYAIHGEPYPSLAFHIRFALMRKRLSLAWRWKIIGSAFYDYGLASTVLEATTTCVHVAGGRDIFPISVAASTLRLRIQTVPGALTGLDEFGYGSCRERGCDTVLYSLVAGV